MKKENVSELISMAMERNKHIRKHPGNEEHNIQVACVRWFRAEYPQLAGLLFAVPNGGWRNETTAAKLKLEGVLPGVADLILLVPSGGAGALMIEMKTTKGRQSEHQKAFQKEVEQMGYRYVVCRSYEDFVEQISNYLKDADKILAQHTAA